MAIVWQESPETTRWKTSQSLTMPGWIRVGVAIPLPKIEVAEPVVVTGRELVEEIDEIEAEEVRIPEVGIATVVEVVKLDKLSKLI